MTSRRRGESKTPRAGIFRSHRCHSDTALLWLTITRPTSMIRKDILGVPMADKTPVEIPFSQFEYTATFARPMLALIGKFQNVVAPFMEVLEAWGFDFEETEFQLASPKPRDHVITFHRPATTPPPQVRVSVRWKSLTISADQADWGETEQLVGICESSLSTIKNVANVKVTSQQIVLHMHIQSKTTSRADLGAVLLTPQARELVDDGKILGQGLILHRESAMILVDNSAAFANGLYVRIQRAFGGEIPLHYIAERLLGDEQKLWAVLGLEGGL